MATSLCETFRSLAFSTHAQLSKARRVGHQPMEETFTDLNILELKDRHPLEIYSKTFSKRREGVNGADWEWWLTNSSRNAWLGLRVQAKVIHLATDTFPHLHYKSGKPKIYQLDRIRTEAFRDGLVPLYCFYTHSAPQTNSPGVPCGSFPYAPESYGCSLASLEHVSALQDAGELHDLASVMAAAIPWHCLVCCAGYAKGDLPHRAREFLQARFALGESEAPINSPRISLIERPPSYVLNAVEGREGEYLPDHTRGVLVIAPREDG